LKIKNFSSHTKKQITNLQIHKEIQEERKKRFQEETKQTCSA